MTVTRESIREAFVAAGFSHIVDELEPLMKDAIAIIGEIKQDDQEIPVGASKLGGAPDLPPNEQWPYWKEGEPLSFICQLNLAEATQHDVQKVLPTSGMLYFFCDAEDDQGVPPTGELGDKGRWKLIHFDGDFSELRRRPVLPELRQYSDTLSGWPDETFAPHKITFQSHITIPSFHIHRSSYSIGPIEIMDQEDVLYEHLERVYDQIRPNPAHQLLGHPIEIQQTDMRIMCQYAWDGKRIHGYEGDPQSNKELLTGKDEWRLLLQIGTTEGYSGAGAMCWGDGGTLYLWMREQDLISGKFEKAWLVLQDA